MAHVLTELESCALGVIRQIQPCSTYQVRCAFARSPTTRWSASAGSLYPVIERLLRLKLIKAEVRAGDARGRRDLSVTQERRASNTRLDHAAGARSGSIAPDPIRSRAHFLDLLGSEPKRATFLLRAENLTQSAIRETRIFLKAERRNSQFDYLVSLGGLYQLEARLKWLRTLR